MKRIADEKKIVTASAVGFSGYSLYKESGTAKFPTDHNSILLLEKARGAWESMSDYRRNRRRNIRFDIGRQWDDLIRDSHGHTWTEEQWIEHQGKAALKNNLIRTQVKSALGLFRSSPQSRIIISRNRQDQKASEMMTVALESVLSINNYKERDAALWHEFLNSGGGCYMTRYGWDHDRQDMMPQFREINMETFFKDPYSRDVCGEDVGFIGDYYDSNIEELISLYAKNIPEELELRHIYSGRRESFLNSKQQMRTDIDAPESFYIPPSEELCRVYRICQLEGRWELYLHDYMDATQTIVPLTQKNIDDVATENAARRKKAKDYGQDVPLIIATRKYVREWVYYHLSPYGNVLFKATNPYEHKNHPYVFKFHPLLQGACMSFVGDMIDQQKMINRWMILNDFMISSAARGLLLVPKECLGDDIKIEDIADSWTTFGGIIQYHAKPGVDPPKQIVSSQINTSAMDMVNMQMSLLQQIGGMHDALQGRAPTSGTPSSLYDQESTNATNNIIDYLEAFNWLLKQRDYRMLQLIKQYFTAPMYIPLIGKDYSDEAHKFEPEKIRNLDFDIEVIKNNNTPTARMRQDELLKDLLAQGAINVEIFLENCSLPFSDRILQQIKDLKAKTTQGQLSQADVQGLQQQMQQEGLQPSSPEQINKLRQTLLGKTDYPQAATPTQKVSQMQQ